MRLLGAKRERNIMHDESTAKFEQHGVDEFWGA